MSPEALRRALEGLKSQGYNVLVDLTAVDFSAWGGAKAWGAAPAAGVAAPAPAAGAGATWGKCAVSPSPAPQGKRFKLVYRLMDLDAQTGLARARTTLEHWVGEDEAGPFSVKDLWACADWLEREVWDMFGVAFRDRPGIKRLLLYEEFAGHPLRKDYPLNKRQPLIGPRDETPTEAPTESDLRPRVP